MVIKHAKEILRIEGDSGAATNSTLRESLGILEEVRLQLTDGLADARLTRYAEGVIGQGCASIVSRNLLSAVGTPPTDQQDLAFEALLSLAARSDNPELDDQTEIQFERSASWGGPAARVEAAQAYWSLLGQRPDISGRLRRPAEELLSDPHPAVRLAAVLRLGSIWETDRDGFWQILRERLRVETNLGVINHVLDGLVSRLIHADQRRSLDLLLELLQREQPGSEREARIRRSVGDKLAVLWVTYGLDGAKVVLDRWVSSPAQFEEELRIVLQTIRWAVVSGVAGNDGRDAGIRMRSQGIISAIVSVANANLAVNSASFDLSAQDKGMAEACVRLIDVAGSQMFFAIGASGGQQGEGQLLGLAGLQVYLSENAGLLERIGEYASPHTTYYLLQIVERLVEVDAAAAFDLAASTLQTAGRSGYQNESLGMDLLVRLVGVFLADHKSIFESPVRRASLVNSLEIFLDAGWPAARRLLYRLPELIQ